MTGCLARTRACTRFEIQKLLARRRTILLVSLIVIAPIIAGLLATAGNEPARGFSLLAEILEVSLPVASFVLTVAGCLVLAEETASGSLRAVAVTPMSRGEIMTGKILALIATAVVAWLVTVGVSMAWVAASGGFSPVTIEIPGLDPIVKFDLATMTAHARRLVLATGPALLCSPVFGLTVATVVEGEGSSMAASVAGYAGLRAWSSTRRDRGPSRRASPIRSSSCPRSRAAWKPISTPSRPWAPARHRSSSGA